jgi:fibro-slime domain-containing protein
MKKEALAVIMATTLLVLSLLSPVAGAVSVSYAADSGGDSVSISESYDVDDTTAVEIKEDLIRSQGQLLKSLEQLIWDIYENVNYNVSIDQKRYSLKRFEDLLVNQSEDEDLLEWLHEQDPPLEDPQPGFCGIYRNFIPTRASGGHPDFNCNVVNGPSPGLIENNPPWRPTSPPQIEDDWYHTASCLVTIDPAVAVAGWPYFTGLDFTPDINAWSNIHPELDERLPGDPCYFTAHWETTITVAADWHDRTPVTFKMCANDDSWLFLDGELIIDRGGGHRGCPPESPRIAVVPLTSGTYAIDLFYAERCNMTPPDGMFEFGISPGPPQVTINDPSHICAKKSFEDLLKRQAERIKSFEDLFETIPPSNRTFELFESFENITKEQGELLKSFEGLIKNETPPPDSDVNRTEENYLLEAELVNLRHPPQILM